MPPRVRLTFNLTLCRGFIITYSVNLYAICASIRNGAILNLNIRKEFKIVGAIFYCILGKTLQTYFSFSATISKRQNARYCL